MRLRTDGAGMRAPAGARWRSRVFTLLQRSLLLWACVYFALVAISGHTYIRSLAFGFALILALWLIAGALLSDAEPIVRPDGYLVAALLLWSGWSALSLAWSIHPDYSNGELRSEIGWGLSTIVIFYVVARSGAAFRILVGTALGICALLSVLAVAGFFGAASVDPEQTLSRSHGGVGAFSTYLVLAMPLLPLLFARPPSGFGPRLRIVVVAIAILVLMLVAAQMIENRMLWIAVAVGFLVAGALGAWRWRERLRGTPWRWLAFAVTVLLLISALFLDAASKRARTDFKGDATVAQTFADDPRFLLWQHTFERIRERPWIGFGFGKSILRDELKLEMRDPLLAHAHNLFVSQWLQTGAIGVATLVALLAALIWCYAKFLRAPDDTLALLGLVGLTLLTSFVVKNLTDDFMIRPTSKEFWALNAILVGWGTRLTYADFAKKSLAKSASG